MKEIIIYTDGSCLNNPGNGGWAAIIIEDGIKKEISGSEKYSTNNRMELTAAIKALHAIGKDKKVKIYTDSKYLKHGIEEWINKWKNNNWKTTDKKDVKNKDLWTDLDLMIKSHKITWEWVKGHSTSEHNNRVDELAKIAANKGNYI